MTGPAPPRVVAFDLMDTVVRDPYREALEAGTGMALEELFRRKGVSVWPAFERGELTEREYWAHFEDAGIDLDADAFHRTRLQGYAWIDGMGRLLDDLDGVVVRVVASNYPVWIDELAAGMLRGRFDHVIASCHLGARKPEPEFYRRLLAEIDAGPDEVVFVDDRETNVAGADAVGLRAHRFRGSDDLRDRLHAEGVALAAG